MKSLIRKIFVLSCGVSFFLGNINHVVGQDVIQKNQKGQRSKKKQALSRPTKSTWLEVGKRNRRPKKGRSRRGQERPKFLKRGGFVEPKHFGMLSIALLGGERLWLDGDFLGRSPVAYLLLGVGEHHLRVVNAGSEQRLKIKIVFDRHLAVVRRRGRLGMRFLRHERVYARMRIYRGRGVKEHLVLPGKHCLRKKRCVFLGAGEVLYWRKGMGMVIRPPLKAKLFVRAYPARGGDGFLTLVTFPMGILYVDGKIYAPTPLFRLPLRMGGHRLEVKNPSMGLVWQRKLSLRSGEVKRIVAFLLPEKGGSLQISAKRPAKIFVDGLFRGFTPIVNLPVKAGIHHFVWLFADGHFVQKRVKVGIGKILMLTEDGSR